METTVTERMDRRQFVQQYVERQKAYLPTYTAGNVLIERSGTRTPSKQLRSNAFGFDTPVLRPRVPENRDKAVRTQRALQAGSSKSPTHGASPLDPGVAGPPPAEAPGKAPSDPTEAQDPALGKKDKPRSKRKKASTPIQTDTDNERAARLADRRERKRKKRAIVNPLQKHDDDSVSTAAPQRARANAQKARKPAALALLYGFSATNVTKDRLTLKPAPSLGVFSKGKASVKKKVTTGGKSCKRPVVVVRNAALKNPVSRSGLFSESAFLNKSSELVVDQSRNNRDLDDSSVSSISNHPAPQVTRATNHTKKDQGRCTKVPTAKTPKPKASTIAESEVWDIEVQSKLPSSACDVSSDAKAEDSAPVVLDLRGAEWATINVAREREERCKNAPTPSLSAIGSRSRGHSIVCCSSLATSNVHDKLGLSHIVGAPSIHPSHSASQVGRYTADNQPTDQQLVTSKYFIEPKPGFAQEPAALAPQASRLNDGVDVLDSRSPDEDVEDAVLAPQAIRRVDSPITSLISVFQPMIGLKGWHDVDPLKFPSDDFPYDDCYARVEMPWGPLGGPEGGWPEGFVVETRGDRSGSIAECQYHHLDQSTNRDWCGSWYPTDDVEGVEGFYDPLARGYEDDSGEWGPVIEPCLFATPAEYDAGEGYCSDQWFRMAETGRDSPAYEQVSLDGSSCFSEESMQDGERGEDVPGFLEGRALLLGVPEDRKERRVGLSGLVQAEMEVATRLRDHWRPLRL